MLDIIKPPIHWKKGALTQLKCQLPPELKQKKVTRQANAYVIKLQKL